MRQSPKQISITHLTARDWLNKEEAMSQKLRREKMINETLGAVYRRHGMEFDPREQVGELVDHRDPAEIAMQHEEETALESDRNYVLASKKIMDWFFADGPHPADVMRRVYAYTKKFHPELIMHMSVRDLGNMFDESHGTWSWRILQLFDRPMKARGIKAVKSPWQKSEANNQVYAQCQKGNQNRAKIKLAESAKSKTKK